MKLSLTMLNVCACATLFCCPRACSDLAELCGALSGAVPFTLNYCDVLFESVRNSLAFTTREINIFKPDSDLVDCAIVGANANVRAELVYGLKAGAPPPTDCRLPTGTEPFEIPDLTV